MSEPVLVIHGIANHDPTILDENVDLLESKTGSRFEYFKVQWGDEFGGKSDGLGDALPVMRQQTGVNLMSPEGSRVLQDAEDLRRELMGGLLVRDEQDVADQLYQATLEELVGPASLTSTFQGGDIQDVFDESAQHLNFIRLLNPQEVDETAKLLADYLRAEQSDQEEGFVKGGLARQGSLSIGAKQRFGRFLRRLDNYAGLLISETVGKMNQGLRRSLAESIAMTLGDIVVYHADPKKIHQRLFEIVETTGCGTAEKPITVLAHSLGGVIAFDAALGCQVAGKTKTLHIKKLITFGSQAAFFHIVSPRTQIHSYKPGAPVKLPQTIGKWTNLWHPMDVLAFTASPVFKLNDGSNPDDIRIDSSASEISEAKLWMHSAYWNHQKLIEALTSD